MCFTKSYNELPKLIPTSIPQPVNLVQKQTKTVEKFKNVKFLKKLVDQFTAQGLDQPSFVKITQRDGTSCEFGLDAFVPVSRKKPTTPLFNQVDEQQDLDILLEDSKSQPDTFGDLLKLMDTPIDYELYETIIN